MLTEATLERLELVEDLLGRERVSIRATRNGHNTERLTRILELLLDEVVVLNQRVDGLERQHEDLSDRVWYPEGRDE